jgi:hypothetical protein
MGGAGLACRVGLRRRVPVGWVVGSTDGWGRGGVVSIPAGRQLVPWLSFGGHDHHRGPRRAEAAQPVPRRQPPAGHHSPATPATAPVLASFPSHSPNRQPATTPGPPADATGKHTDATGKHAEAPGLLRRVGATRPRVGRSRPRVGASRPRVGPSRTPYPAPPTNTDATGKHADATSKHADVSGQHGDVRRQHADATGKHADATGKHAATSVHVLTASYFRRFCGAELRA